MCVYGGDSEDTGVLLRHCLPSVRQEVGAPSGWRLANVQSTQQRRAFQCNPQVPYFGRVKAAFIHTTGELHSEAILNKHSNVEWFPDSR